MALGEDRLGRQCADATIIGIDRVAWSALRPAEQPDKRRLAERAHDPGHHGTDEIPLKRRLGENAVEFHAAQRRGGLGRVRHIDEDRMGARLGERLFGTMDRLGDDRQARQRAVDAEHGDGDPLADERLRPPASGMAPQWPIAESLRRSPHPVHALGAHLGMAAERTAGRSGRDSGLFGDHADRDNHGSTLVARFQGRKKSPSGARGMGSPEP